MFRLDPRQLPVPLMCPSWLFVVFVEIVGWQVASEDDGPFYPSSLPPARFTGFLAPTITSHLSI